MTQQWFWYVAQPDELMMDCDSQTLVQIAEKRLAREDDFLIRDQRIYPSQSPDHFHLIVRMAEPMHVLRRMVWQLYFFDHVYRSVQNFWRVIEDSPAPSLLISPDRWEDFWREPDAICMCEARQHKKADLILFCPAHRKLRGNHP